MSSDRRDRLAEFLTQSHTLDEQNACCECGWYYGSPETYYEHLADAFLGWPEEQPTEAVVFVVQHHDGIVGVAATEEAAERILDEHVAKYRGNYGTPWIQDCGVCQ